MRYFQLVESEYTNKLHNTIVTLLLAVSSEGIREIDTSQLVRDLQAQGFSEINDSNIVAILNDLPIVSSATTDTISIKVDTPLRATSDEVASREKRHLDKVAQKQAKKDLGI